MKLKRIAIAFCFSILFIGLIANNSVSVEYNDKSSIAKLDSKTVLVTGFESWLDIYNPNPSQLIAENLSGKEIDGATIISIILPVIWGEAVDVLTKAITDYGPDIVISLGAGKISSIHVEKIGLNLKSCIYPDNEGKRFLFRRIDRRGPCIKFSHLPVKDIVEEINEAEIPAEQSYSAGKFICNEVMYGVLNFVAKNDLSTKVGFIHVPLLPAQDPEKGMELETMIDAIEIAITVCLEEF